jgi:hypothetical protein
MSLELCDIAISDTASEELGELGQTLADQILSVLLDSIRSIEEGTPAPRGATIRPQGSLKDGVRLISYQDLVLVFRPLQPSEVDEQEARPPRFVLVAARR